MSSCWYSIIKSCAIKTHFNTKWIPAGRQEKGEQCSPWLEMIRHCYSEMLFPPRTQKRTICTSFEHLHALPLQLPPQYLPSAQTLVKLLPYCWPLPGQQLWENKAPSIRGDFFYLLTNLNASRGCLKDPLPPWCLCSFWQPHRAWTARVYSNHQAP